MALERIGRPGANDRAGARPKFNWPVINCGRPFVLGLRNQDNNINNNAPLTNGPHTCAPAR